MHSSSPSLIVCSFVRHDTTWVAGLSRAELQPLRSSRFVLLPGFLERGWPDLDMGFDPRSSQPHYIYTCVNPSPHTQDTPAPRLLVFQFIAPPPSSSSSRSS